MVTFEICCNAIKMYFDVLIINTRRLGYDVYESNINLRLKRTVSFRIF